MALEKPGPEIYDSSCLRQDKPHGGFTVNQARARRKFFRPLNPSLGKIVEESSHSIFDGGRSQQGVEGGPTQQMKIAILEKIVDTLTSGFDPTSPTNFKPEFPTMFKAIIESLPDETILTDLLIPSSKINTFMSFMDFRHSYPDLFKKVQKLEPSNRRTYAEAINIFSTLKRLSNQQFENCETLGDVRAVPDGNLFDIKHVGNKNILFIKLLRTPYVPHQSAS